MKTSDDEVAIIVEALSGCPIAEAFGNARGKVGKYPSLGSSIEDLIRIWLGSKELENPVDIIRDRMIKALERNWDVWSYRLSCDGNCYNHPDARVIACYLESGTCDLYGDKKDG